MKERTSIWLKMERKRDKGCDLNYPHFIREREVDFKMICFCFGSIWFVFFLPLRLFAVQSGKGTRKIEVWAGSCHYRCRGNLENECNV